MQLVVKMNNDKIIEKRYNVGIDYDSWDDCMPWEEYLNWCKQWLKECYRVLKDDGRICINHYIAFSPLDFTKEKQHQCRFPLFDFREIMTNIGFNPSCIVRKNPQIPNTVRQVACHPVNNSRGKRSSIPPYNTRPDSPVPTLQ